MKDVLIASGLLVATLFVTDDAVATEYKMARFEHVVMGVNDDTEETYPVHLYDKGLFTREECRAKAVHANRVLVETKIELQMSILSWTYTRCTPVDVVVKEESDGS